MDDVECNILNAWRRIEPTLSLGEVERRLRRGRLRTYSGVPREWCVVVRASDPAIEACRMDADLVDTREPHELLLTAPAIRELCAHVEILQPGEDLPTVSQKLRLGYGSIGRLRAHGLLRTRWVFGLAASGKWRPLFNWDGWIDPTSRLTDQPDELFSWSSRFTFVRVPESFSQVVLRVPLTRTWGPHRLPADRIRPPPIPPPPERDWIWYKWKNGVYIGDRFERERIARRERRRKRYKPRLAEHPRPPAGTVDFAGWRLKCPACSRLVRLLYMPVRRFNLIAENFHPEAEGEIVSVIKAACAEPVGRVNGFACAGCHAILHLSRADRNAWNHVVTFLTGGLLYGREVQRPAWFGGPERKRAYRPRFNRPAPMRDKIRRRLLNGWTQSQIARDLGISLPNLSIRMGEIFRAEGVADRHALAEKLKSPHKQPVTHRDRGRRLRPRVEGLMRAGLTNPQIARALDLPPHIVAKHVHRIYRAAGVHTRADWLARAAETCPRDAPPSNTRDGPMAATC